MRHDMVKKTIYFYQENITRDGFTKKDNIVEKKEKDKEFKYDKDLDKLVKKDIVKLDITDGECPCKTCGHITMQQCYEEMKAGTHVGGNCCSEQCS